LACRAGLRGVRPSVGSDAGVEPLGLFAVETNNTGKSLHSNGCTTVYSAVTAIRKGAHGVMRERKVMLEIAVSGRGFSQR